MSLQHRGRSLITFSPFGSPATSPLIGGKFFYQKPSVSPQPITSSCETTPATPSSSLLQPENQKFFDCSGMNLNTELQKSTPLKKSEHSSKFPPLSPSSVVHSPTLAGTEMYTIFEEDSGSQSGSFESEKTLPNMKSIEHHSNHKPKLTRQNAVLFDTLSGTSTKDGQVGGIHMKRYSLPSLKPGSQCQETNRSKDPSSLESVQQRRGSVVSKDTCSHQSTEEFPSLPPRGKMSAISAVTCRGQPSVEKPYAVEYPVIQSDQEERSGNDEGGDMLSQSLPASLLTSEWHKQHPQLSEQRSAGRELCQKRKHSLPTHIQRIFPDLVPKPPSPLVLHELRSPPTGAESIRRCSSPFPTSTTSCKSSDEEDRPVLCGGLPFMNSPRTSPKGPRKHSASPILSPSKPSVFSQNKEDQIKKFRNIETSSPTKQGNKGYVFVET